MSSKLQKLMIMMVWNLKQNYQSLLLILSQEHELKAFLMNGGCATVSFAGRNFEIRVIFYSAVFVKGLGTCEVETESGNGKGEMESRNQEPAEKEEEPR